MSPRQLRRAAEHQARKQARKAEKNTMNNINITTRSASPSVSTEPEQPQSEQQHTEQEARPYAAAAAAAVAAAKHVDTNFINSAFDFKDDDGSEDPYTVASRILEKALGSGVTKTDTTPPEETKPDEISAARLAANRANAQLSTGPRSSAGKSRVSMNAVKTGITAQTIILTATQAPAYESHVERRYTKYAPVGDDENMLVQMIVDNEWRLTQIAPSEAAIYAIGFRQFAGDFADETNPATREALLRGQIQIHFRRDLSNLSLQERRIRNHIETDVAKLQAMQRSRMERRKNQIEYCVKLRQSEGETFQPADCGFDFSVAELDAFFEETQTLYNYTKRRGDFDVFLTAHRNQQKGAQAA